MKLLVPVSAPVSMGVSALSRYRQMSWLSPSNRLLMIKEDAPAHSLQPPASCHFPHCTYDIVILKNELNQFATPVEIE